MFDAPEYASYIQLCRELRLEREFEEGDFFELTVSNDGAVEVSVWTEPAYLMPTATALQVWLPRLDQWLTMLEEAGFHHVSFFRRDHVGGVHADAYSAVGGKQYTPKPPRGANGATHEEAAGRLWMAATGGRDA